jgi:LysM domain
MRCEQLFDKSVDTEHLFVLHCGDEQVFEGGNAMSVALELEYEAIYPRLRVVPPPPPGQRTSPSARVQRRRLLLGAVAVALLVLLALPIRALGGKTVAQSGPTAGQEYVVRSGDTLASIATQVDRTNVAGIEQRLASEAGSTVLVPGEQLLIP